MDGPAPGILTVVCSDRPGIVAAISGLLAAHGANILDAQQHSDQFDQTFFIRVEFDPTGMDVPPGDVGPLFTPLAESFQMRWGLRFSDQLLSMAIMVSREEHCLIDLLARHRIGELRVCIPLIISNHPDLEPLATAFGIPFRVIPVTARTKPEAEEQALALLREAHCDFVVLARYMQILSPTFLAAYPSAIINIHHSFLPAFAGARAYHRAHERGVKLIGATSHYATEVLDEGPIIEQDVTRVSHRDSIEDLMAKGRDMERMVLARAVRAHAEDRVIVHGIRTVVFD